MTRSIGPSSATIEEPKAAVKLIGRDRIGPARENYGLFALHQRDLASVLAALKAATRMPIRGEPVRGEAIRSSFMPRWQTAPERAGCDSHIRCSLRLDWTGPSAS